MYAGIDRRGPRRSTHRKDRSVFRPLLTPSLVRSSTRRIAATLVVLLAPSLVGAAYAVAPTAAFATATSLARAHVPVLATTYRSYGATDWASTYTCGTDGTRSEHYDGRAIDWMVSVTDRRQHAAAKAFLAWLLATDKAGNRFAMARRLGVMYVIYDNRMWGAWDGRWEQYDGCFHHPQPAYANTCHRTHMHI